ncbi:MAG: S-layer homology domain-containing protein [bacterium]
MNLKKNFITFILLFSFINFSSLLVLAQNFLDLKPDYWAYNPIQALSMQNILSGYSDNTFRPENPVTRAEFATMIVKTLDKENMPIERRVGFTDVSSSFWAYDNIQKAVNLGLIKGFPDQTFKPYEYITKSQALAILSTTIQTGYLSESEAKNILSRFYDENRVPKWAIIPVAKAVKADLAVNYPQPNFLMPEKKVSRAEVAAMLYNLREKIGLSQIPQQAQSIQQPVTTTIDQISQAAAGGATADIMLKGSIATIQANSVIPTELETPVSSEIASVGDPVILKVPRNITTSQGILLIPTGSRIEGKIISVTPAKLANRNASMNIKFNSITFPSGQKFPLQASVATETGLIEAGSLKEKIGKGLLTTIVGAGSGAALGTALGAITGSVGKGAIYGTAIGGGLGAVGAVLAHGGAIQIPSGEPLFIKLDSPLSVDTTSGTVIPY